MEQSFIKRERRYGISPLGCLIVFAASALCACASDPPPKTKPARDWTWINDQLYQQYANGQISAQEVNHAFAVAKNSCLIESLKIPVPSPSCTQAPTRDCSGLGNGAARGFCEGSPIAGQDCDYSSVDEAHTNQNRVYESCLEVAGWRKTFEPFEVKSTPPPAKVDAPLPPLCAGIRDIVLDDVKLRDTGIPKSWPSRRDQDELQAGKVQLDTYTLETAILDWVYEAKDMAGEEIAQVWVDKCVTKVSK